MYLDRNIPTLNVMSDKFELLLPFLGSNYLKKKLSELRTTKVISKKFYREKEKEARMSGITF